MALLLIGVPKKTPLRLIFGFSPLTADFANSYFPRFPVPTPGALPAQPHAPGGEQFAGA